MDLDVDVAELAKASSMSRNLSEEQEEAALEFMLQRLHNQLREKGFSHELTTLAVSSMGSMPNQALKLLRAFQEVQGTDWFGGLVTSAVRVRNILQKTEGSDHVLDVGLFSEEAERSLFEAIEGLSPRVDKAVRAWDWNGLTQILSKLEPYVSTFFDKVLVMDNDERIRNNRIALLERCDGLFKTSGDLGLLKS
jgi:glycyl-tRNA synthetase beta chain